MGGCAPAVGYAVWEAAGAMAAACRESMLIVVNSFFSLRQRYGALC